MILLHADENVLYDLPESSPPYSPSVAPPKYESRVRSGEQRLEINRGSEFIFLQSDGVFTKSTRKKEISLNLYNQDSALLYGRNAIIQGTVSLAFGAIEVKQVTICLEGTLEMTARDIFDMVRLIRLERVLWPIPGRIPYSSSVRVPSELPFAFRLPLASYPEGANRSCTPPLLPPTYSVKNVDGFNQHNFSASVKYAITIEVQTSRTLFNKYARLSVPVTYYPRSRPPLPALLPPATFLNTLKSSPDEWMQKTSYIVSRKADVASLEVHVVVPKGLVYTLGVPLPFYVQLQGPADATTQFSSRLESTKITVAFVRRTGFTLNAQDYHKVDLLGKGACRRVPRLSSIGGTTEDSDNVVVAWEGEITPACPGNIPTFEAGSLHMKDYLCVSLFPEDCAGSPFSTHRHMVPVRLVTDHFDSNEFLP